VSDVQPHVSPREASVPGLIARVPRYLSLLFGLLRDSRVALIDRALVIGALVYLVSPLDVLPDVIPILGQIDDLFLVVTSVSRLIDRTSRDVILSHWRGRPEELDPTVLRKLVYFASLFAPAGRRRRLRKLATGGGPA
jgi:uncharacterized membrane protein YkvA (DUF1232 family)